MYLRTEETIYELVCPTCADDKYVVREKHGSRTFGIDISRERGIANTIEELCDEFVIEFEDKSHALMEDKSQIKEAWDINRYFHSIIYGAIWTDSGLIYVAKVNDEGESELL